MSAPSPSPAPLWTKAQAQAALAGQASGPDWQAYDVAIDSRAVKPGDLFVALKGPNFDGHDFVADALGKGAVAAIIDHRPANLSPEAPLIQTADSFAALEALGQAGRARSQAKIVAVTGSVGKTGTKEALRHVLSAQGPTYATAGSFNNHWGVPLSLARLPSEARYGVFELGMNHPGELTPLSRMVQPDAAIITTIEAVHIEFFSSLDEIADAKAEIFLGLKLNGAAILNRDNTQFPRLDNHARKANVGEILSFGKNPAADFQLIDCVLEADCSKVTANWRGKTYRYKVGIPGRHWVQNSLAILLAVAVLGADVERAADALATLSPPQGRGQRHHVKLADGGELLLIDDSYNASPASITAALDVLATLTPSKDGRRIAVLGDMLEMGAQGPALHAGLLSAVMAGKVDKLFCCGPLMRNLYDRVPAAMQGAHAPDAKALLPLVAAAVRSNDIVLCKSSKGSKVSLIVDHFLKPALQRAV